MKLKRTIFWSLNFLVLSMFSLYAASSMLGFGTHKAYAAALNNNNFYQQSKHFVVVHGEHNGNPDPGGAGMTSNGQEICSLTPTQEQQLDAFFDVQTDTIKVSDGTDVQVAVVSGQSLTKEQLLRFLRVTDQSLHCHVIGTAHVFFLPVLPQIS